MTVNRSNTSKNKQKERIQNQTGQKSLYQLIYTLVKNIEKSLNVFIKTGHQLT